MKLKFIGSIFLVLLFMQTFAFAQSADEIIQKMDKKLFINSSSIMTLVFTDEKNNKEIYSMTTYARDRNQRIIVRFMAPAKMAGNDLLMLERNVWYYDSKNDRILRIPSNQSFGGTGFSYGDVVRLNYSENYNASIISTKNDGGWIVDLIAKERDAPYYHIQMEIDKSFNPVKGTCFGRSGEIIKEMIYSNIRDVGGGSKPITVTVTSPLEPGRISVLTISKEIPKDYPESIFNKRNLSARLEEQY